MPDPYDVLTIAAITDELSATVGNGRIQRIGLVDARTIGAEIYAGGRRHYLLASADERLPRLRLASEMPSLDPTLVTPFGLLLRKYARGGIILGIDQPPLERLVRFSIARRLTPLKTSDDMSETTSFDVVDDESVEDEQDDMGTAEDDAGITYVTLYVELMGRHSNLILVDNAGQIMESAKRVTPAMSRVRTVLPRHAYLPPPPPDRLDPRNMTLDDAQQLLSTLPVDADLARPLVSAFRGISPLMAREIVFRATRDDDSGEVDAAALVNATRALLAPLQMTGWSPRVYRERDGAGDPQPTPGEVVAFAPISMAHLAADYDEEVIGSISAAAALAESAAQRPSPLRHAQRRQRLLDAVSAARDRAEHRLASLAKEAARAAEAERLKAAGELIYAHLWQMAPGQTELVVDDTRISLDPGLSPTENAQAYFERYRKAQSAETQLPELAEESRAEIAYLDQLTTLIAQAPGFSELEALAAEWSEQTTPEDGKRPRRKPAPRRPSPLVDEHGNSVYIGRSGPQNDLVTFDIAGPDDTWLHARGVGGSHVIVRWQNSSAPEDPDTIAAAAALAAWYSAARESSGVEVDVTRRRYVRKIKGARPGMVTYRNERTIRVQPAPEERLHDLLRGR